VESHATTSPPSCSANQTANDDFPDAVGPMTATSGGVACSEFIESRNSSKEEMTRAYEQKNEHKQREKNAA
jgi:hypothetical protein